MLTQKTREQLVLLINSGKNSYADIKQAIPELTDADLRIASLPMLINDLSERVLSLDHHPSGDAFRYEFTDTDRFSLSIYGEDLLYKIQKEQILTVSQDEAIKWAKVAAIATIIFGMISIALQIVLTLMTH